MTVLRALFGSFFLLLAGCVSYSYRGSVADASADTRQRQGQCHFVLDGYALKVGAEYNEQSGYATLATKKQLESYLIQHYPEAFGPYASAVPITVKVDHTASQRKLSGLIVYFLTLGVLPGVTEMQDKYTVQVGLPVGEENISVKKATVCDGTRWVSAFTPFAMLMSKPVENKTGSCRAASCLADFTMAEGNHIIDVYIETVGEAIFSCLSKIDQNELQRKVLLNQLRGP